ncbi:helix-turn-helix domain-containing protein [Chitinophaga agri]|uniref:Helix-turn-helix transcriptional regulator n=1 Tax=Chitinophaga agri TaxID=2703787 RepID=A0A6B9ZG90_9BACT|nr:AraC family transcriptional regulator [Chitinophaga agri]QHS61076.1 helix-turn-helix transcriptional regulator [Chitinophaga agri]
MRSILFKANKLLLIEKNRQSYIPASSLPVEYHKLIIPYAGLYFREDGECEILSQHINVGPFSLWLHDIFSKERIVLLPYTPYHLWTLHFMYEDTLEVENPGRASFRLEERECNLFNLYPGLHRIPMEDNTKVLSVHFNIRPEFLPKLAEKYPQLRDLLTRPMPAQTGPLNARPHNINPVCDFIIQKILTCQYTGRQAHTFLYSACLELLLNFAHQEKHADEPFLFSSLAYQDEYQQLFRYMVEHPHRPCSIAELSLLFNIPMAELEKGFLQHFSMTIQDCSHMLRMIVAYNALYTNNWSLEMIAETVGFSNTHLLVEAMEAYFECKVNFE